MVLSDALPTTEALGSLTEIIRTEYPDKSEADACFRFYAKCSNRYPHYAEEHSVVRLVQLGIVTLDANTYLIAGTFLSNHINEFATAIGNERSKDRKRNLAG